MEEGVGVLIQLEVNDKYGDFFLQLIKKLKSSIVEKITILEPILTDKESFQSFTNNEKWDIYGSYDSKKDPSPQSQHKYIFEQLEEEYGSEIYNTWKK